MDFLYDLISSYDKCYFWWVTLLELLSMFLFFVVVFFSVGLHNLIRLLLISLFEKIKNRDRLKYVYPLEVNV